MPLSWLGEVTEEVEKGWMAGTGDCCGLVLLWRVLEVDRCGVACLTSKKWCSQTKASSKDTQSAALVLWELLWRECWGVGNTLCVV